MTEDVFEIGVVESHLRVVGGDVFELAQADHVATSNLEGASFELTGADVVEVEVGGGDVFQLFESGVFGGGGGSATDGATLASIEADGFAYVGREVADDANATGTSTWQVYRVPAATLGDTPVYASGVTTFIHIWANRTALSYP